MNATARVLTVMASLGVFTVEDLAARAGVREVTVRTVIDRNKEFVKQAGIRPTGRPGGQPILYQLDPGREAELQDKLAKVRAGLIPEDPGITDSNRLPAMLAADPVWLPLSVSAAESILLDELPNSDVGQRSALLQAADEYIRHARHIREEADDSEPATHYLAAHLDLLEFLRAFADAEDQAVRTPPPYAELRARLWKLPWCLAKPGASEGVFTRLGELAQAAASREAAAMPINILYPGSHGVPSRLDEALKRVIAGMNAHMHVEKISVQTLGDAARIIEKSPRPLLCVLAFDHASIHAHDPAIMIPAAAGAGLGELVVASEDLDEEVYQQAATNGASFVYLGEAAERELRGRINHATERISARALQDSLGLSQPAGPRIPVPGVPVYA